MLIDFRVVQFRDEVNARLVKMLSTAYATDKGTFCFRCLYMYVAAPPFPRSSHPRPFYSSFFSLYC